MIGSSSTRRHRQPASIQEAKIKAVVRPIARGLTALAVASTIALAVFDLADPASMLLSIIACIVLGAITVATHFGYEVQAGRTLVAALWILVASSTIFYRGIFGHQTVLFPMVSAITYVFIGKRWGNRVTLLSVLWLIMLYVGYVTVPALQIRWSTSIDPFAALFVIVISIVAGVAVSQVAEQELQHALDQAHAQAVDLQLEIERRQKVEETLRLSNKRFNVLVDNIDAVFWLADAKTLRPTYASPAFSKIMNMPLERALEPTMFIERVHPDDRDAYHVEVQKLRKAQTSVTDMEFRVQTADGTTKWIWERTWGMDGVDGNIDQLAGLSIDISERVIAKQELAQSRELLQLVINNIPANISYIDQRRLIRFINREMPDMEGTPLRELYQKENYEKLQPFIDAALGGEEQMFHHQIKRYDGDLRELRMHYLPYFVGDAVKGVFTLSWDITAELRTQEALQQTQKLESLGVLAGGIAHDFNNLLVVMLGQTSLAKMRLEEGHPASGHINKAVSAAERASKLTKQMLAYSGRGQFEIRPILLNQLIEQNLHLFASSLSKYTTLSTNYLPDLPFVEADTTQLQQVIMNLIINAAQAIGDQPGNITLATSEVEIGENDTDYSKYTAQPLQPGSYACVSVSDTGSGMTEATLAHLFDPFYTTKASGSGLGLAAVLGIVRGHSGGIHVESTPNAGTTFKVLFPASDRKPLGAAFNHKPTISAEPTSTILIIDDEPTVGEAIEDILNSVGYTTIYANGGKDGLEKFKQHFEQVDLTILDLSMPEMNGEQVFIEMRRIDPTANIILSSGYSQQEATRHLIGQGLAGFLSKPYDFDALIDHVQKHLGRGTAVAA